MNENIDLIRIGDNLRKIREDLGYTQYKMGDIIGCSERQIRRYENGDQISIQTILYYVNALGVNAKDILFN